MIAANCIGMPSAPPVLAPNTVTFPPPGIIDGDADSDCDGDEEAAGEAADTTAASVALGVRLRDAERVDARGDGLRVRELDGAHPTLSAPSRTPGKLPMLVHAPLAAAAATAPPPLAAAVSADRVVP